MVYCFDFNVILYVFNFVNQWDFLYSTYELWKENNEQLLLLGLPIIWIRYAFTILNLYVNYVMHLKVKTILNMTGKQGNQIAKAYQIHTVGYNCKKGISVYCHCDICYSCMVYNNRLYLKCPKSMFKFKTFSSTLLKKVGFFLRKF